MEFPSIDSVIATRPAEAARDFSDLSHLLGGDGLELLQKGFEAQRAKLIERIMDPKTSESDVILLRRVYRELEAMGPKTIHNTLFKVAQNRRAKE